MGSGAAKSFVFFGHELNEGGGSMFENLGWFVPTERSGVKAVELKHVDSQFCWCEPVVEVDNDGEEVLIHRQVTWN